MRTTILYLGLLIHLGASAQLKEDVLPHFKALWETMAKSDSYRTVVTVSRIQLATGKVVGTSQAKAFKKGLLFRSEMAEQLALFANDHLLVVDPLSKVIVVKDRDRSTEKKPNDPLHDWAETLKGQGAALGQWRVISKTAREVVLSSPPLQGPYRSMRITLRLADHLPVRVEYDLATNSDLDFDRVRLDYTEMVVNCTFPADTFSEKHFVRFQGKKATPAPAYHDHEVQYTPGS